MVRIQMIKLWVQFGVDNYLHFTSSLCKREHLLSLHSASIPHSYKWKIGMENVSGLFGWTSQDSCVMRMVSPFAWRSFILQDSSRVLSYSYPLYSSPSMYPHVSSSNAKNQHTFLATIKIIVLNPKTGLYFYNKIRVMFKTDQFPIVSYMLDSNPIGHCLPSVFPRDNPLH